MAVRFGSIGGLALAAMVLATSTSAAAQNLDLSAGYQGGGQLLNGGAQWNTFPTGWYVDLSSAVRPRIAVVGEVGGVYESTNTHEYSYQGGIRLFSSTNPTLTPFAQALVGASTSGTSASSMNAFSMQGGGGIEIMPVHRLGIRIAADYRRVFFSGADGGAQNDIRIAVGAVFHVGK
jgi:hypothetical protein